MQIEWWDTDHFRVVECIQWRFRQLDILMFDEANSNLDPHTAKQFAQTVNKLKGKVTIVFITHQLPKVLMVDEVIEMGKKINPNNNQTN